MTLRLSVNRCGFDMNLGELRDAIADLTRLAGEIGEAIGIINASVAATPAEIRARASALRAHRGWLLEQADLLKAKLELYKDRMGKAAIDSRVLSMRVSVPAWPHGPVRIERRL